MIKVIDIDGLFDKYISDYVYSNVGKASPEEIENKIPELYEKFGDEALNELDGKTPNTYYAETPATELVNALKQHVEQGVPVSDFLCEALRDGDSETTLVKALSEEENEEFILYCMNILNDKGSKLAYNKYLNFILWDYSETIRELATELLGEMANLVKGRILSEFYEVDETKKACLTEILSKAGKDDKVFDILIEQFAIHQDEIPLYAGYLARYGDERALPFLLTAIENEKLSYSDFNELKFAIESLGGEYDKERDFTKDKVYKKIKGIEDKAE